MTYNYKEIIRNCYRDILVNHDFTKLRDYFHEDAQVIINTTCFNNLKEFEARLNWIANNTKKVEVEVIDVISEGEKISDHHITSIVSKDQSGKFGVITQALFSGNKIKLYVNVEVVIEGDIPLSAATQS